jgi:hypothetical protein
MRFSSVFAFFLLVAATVALPIVGDRIFSEIFDVTMAGIVAKSDQPPYKYLRSADRQCMREKLKMEANGHRLVSKVSGLFAVVSAASLCTANIASYYDEVFDAKVTKITSNPSLTSHVDCLKERLHELQPTSDLLDGFNADQTSPDCSFILANTDLGMTKKLDESTARYRQLGIEHCMARDLNESKANAYRLLVLIYTQPENAEKLEREKRESNARAKKQDAKLFGCIVSGIEGKFDVDENVL